MATRPSYSVEFPPSLMEDVSAAAERDCLSLNSFIVQAVAEKIAMLRARGLVEPLSAEEQKACLEDRAARGRPGGLAAMLLQGGTNGALPGDELPEEWARDDPPGNGSVPERSERPDIPGRADWS